MHRVLMFILVLGLCGSSLADEGTNDPDFDYWEPEEVSFFSSITNSVMNFFYRPKHPGSYTTAKKLLYSKVKDEQTLYCACEIDVDRRNFDRSTCEYVPVNDNDRAKRLEAEHVLPAYWIANFNSGENCWVSSDSCGSSRACCLKNDSQFKRAHNDLVNLMPSIGELNAARNHFIYGVIPEEQYIYGRCDFEVDNSTKVAEPKKNIRGDIARIYMYMRHVYSLEFPPSLEAKIQEWHEQDPVSASERERNERILKVQGSSNPFVK